MIITATICRSGTHVTRQDGMVKPHLIIPYTLEANDMRFTTPQGFNSGDQFFTYLRDSFARSSGFSIIFSRTKRVLICRRQDIADHWIVHHPPYQEAQPAQ